jgi:RNA polymerase sigma-70 factor, ECF subfamily
MPPTDSTKPADQRGQPAVPDAGAGADRRDSLDSESVDWLITLRGPDSERAVGRLHVLLLRIARTEVRRRNGGGQITGPELDDLAYQAAADAVISITRKLEEFRGESRFTTWAYKFVIFEVSTKMGRHFWRNARWGGEPADWECLPDRFGIPPAEQAESKELLQALRTAAEKTLTDRQRHVFESIVLQGVPLDALAASLGTNRNALYKMMFDTRRKLRMELIAQGYLDSGVSGVS